MIAEDVARLFHENYERLAPEYGYETRKESAVAWETVPAQNKALMVAVSEVVLIAVVAAVVDDLQYLKRESIPFPRKGLDVPRWDATWARVLHWLGRAP